MVNVSNRWKGKTAVVTGASSGIGSAIVKKLSQYGINVVGFARRKEKMEELAKKLKTNPGKFLAAKVDVTKENEIIDGFKWAKNNSGPIHILINNAGVAEPTTLIDGDSKMWKKNFDTNVLSLCIATREAVKDMRANNVDGQIININSILGHWVFNIPEINVYPATKFAVTALTQTLRYELMEANTKIKVTSISPGVVNTGMTNIHKSHIKDRRLTLMLKPEDVADSVAYVLGTPPHVQIQELMIRPLGEK